MNLPLGQMSMADQTAAAICIGLTGMCGEKRVQFGLNRLRDQIARALA